MEHNWCNLPIYQGLLLGFDVSPLLLDFYSLAGRFRPPLRVRVRACGNQWQDYTEVGLVGQQIMSVARISFNIVGETRLSALSSKCL